MKTFYQFPFLISFFIMASLQTYGQKNDSITNWEASISSGLFADLLYADISLIGDTDLGGGPLYYSDRSG